MSAILFPKAVRASLILVVAILVVARAPGSEPDKPDAGKAVGPVDRYGDPLPWGATARLGSSRLRHLAPLRLAAFSPDSRTLATLGWTLRLWDVDTGRLVQRLEPNEWMDVALVFSPDGKKLVTAHISQVHIWDLARGKKQPLWTDRKYRGTALRVALSPDGKVLALGGNIRKEGSDYPQIRLYDFNSLRELALLEPTERGDIGTIIFSADGKRLLVGAGSGVEIWDVAGRKRLERIQLKCGVSTLTVAREDPVIAVHLTDDSVELREVPSGKPLPLAPLKGRFPSTLHFTANGKTLLFASYDGPVMAARLNSREPAREVIPRPDIPGSAIFDPQHKRMAHFSDHGGIHIWDLATGRRLPAIEDHRDGLLQLVPSPEGKRAATLAATEIRLWEVRSGKMLLRIPGKRFVAGLRWAADGRSLSACDSETLRWWDAETGQLLRQVRLPAQKWLSVAVLEDGQHALGFSKETTGPDRYRLLEATTGKEAVGSALPEEWRVAAVSTNADSYLTITDRATVQLRSMGTDRLIWERSLPDGSGRACFSADGRLVALMPAAGLRVWETATGRAIGARSVSQGPFLLVRTLCLSHDGRTAAVTLDHDDTYGTLTVGRPASHVVLFEVASGQVRRRLPRLDGGGACAFTPTGDYLITPADGAPLVWEVYPQPGGSTGPVDAAQARRLWDELADANAERAFTAICRLRAAPGEAVALLGARLSPVTIDTRRVLHLLSDLDSDQFANRQAATQELIDRGEEAEPILRETLKNAPTLELRRRIEAVLDQVEERACQPAALQRLRAVEVLEHAGTPEANKLLQRLAKGAKGARLSLAAQAALERLGHRPGPRSKGDPG